MGAGAAHLGECRFGADSVGVVAGGHQHLGSDVQPDANGFDELWCQGRGLLLQVPAVNLDLVVQL
jgi:hypothetical protein